MCTLYKDGYFKGLDTIQKLREENEELRNEIKSYKETLEIYSDSKLMKYLIDFKKKGLPLKECIPLKELFALDKEVAKK